MVTIQELALYGTMVEIGLIVIMISVIVILKVITQYRNKQTLNNRVSIELTLKKHIKNEIQIHADNFPEEYKDLEILLFIIHDFDKYQVDEGWLMIRISLIRNILLPLAREAVKSDDWKMRHYAAQAFALYSENCDEKLILKLINDNVPLVRYSASSAGIIHGTEKLFDTIIQRMSKENWQTQTLYLKSFSNIPAATHYFIDRLMKTSSDNAIKSTCYNLLLSYPVFVSDWDVLKDVKSNDIKLSLAAVRYLMYSQREASAERMIDLLNHKDWRMRAVVISCLGELKLPVTIKNLAQALNDQSWWVRFSARQALHKFGEPGKKILASNAISSDEINIDVSRQILSTF